jgi:hypothetical protein
VEAASTSASSELCEPARRTACARRFRCRRIADPELVEDTSDGTSSSVSDEDGAISEGTAGKQNLGSVGMVTGIEGLVERRGRVGKVGEIGDDCGLRRRRKVEMGVLAMTSASSVSFFSTRLLRELADVRWTKLRSGEDERCGGDESG